MALDTIAALRGSTGRTGGRGRPDTVTVRASVIAALTTTGIALAMETMRAADTIQTVAAVGGSRQVIIHSAGRIGEKATAALKELRALAAKVEPR